MDCAHLLSTHQKMKLAEWNHINQTKLILLGNKDTLLPQQRGVSLEQLMMHGIKPISIIEKSEINKTSFETKFIGIINKSVNNIIEVADKDNRHQAMVNHYGRLPEKNRKQTWIVADNKQSAEQLNIDSHAKLVENKILNKPVSLKILTPIFLTEEKSCLATSYKTNQKVRFNAAYVSIEIERGEYLQVVRHSKASNRVLLKKENGKQVIWRPDQIAGKLPGKIELFSEKSREFCTGESIIFNRSIKSKGITKGERFIVDHIDQKKIKFKNSHGKTVVLDLTKPFYRHIDYGYAATAHAIAHEKPTCLITDMPIKSFHTNQRKFYQIISQPKIAWIYTDNQQGLITQLEKKTGDRLAAHDIYAQSQETKKNIHNIFDILEKQIAKQKEGKSRFDITRQVVTAIEYAMHHLTEREAGFTHKQLLETAMCHSLGDVTEKMLTKATMAMEKANILRRGDKNDGTLWTTIDAVKVEREIIALCNQDKGKLVPIANDELIQKFCDPNKLKFEQITAIKAIVQSKDRIMAIQGYPGTGKTTMLATLQEVLAAKDMFKTEQYELLGLAPTNKAVRELKKRGIPAQTVDSFILQVQRARETGVLPRQQNLVLVVDETSMVSNRRALEILKISHELDCRLIPVGDERQLPSVESGKVHSLIQTQVDTKRLTAIQRQKTPILVEAVDNTIKYDFKKAFAVLKDSIIEINEKTLPLSKDLTESKNHERINAEIRKKRIDRLVVDFLSFPKKEWDNIQIITPGHDDRVLVNECLRTKLKESGVLKEGKDQFFNILAAKSFTNVERSRVTNFVIGDVLRFGKSEAVGIKAGEYLTIVGKEQESHLLILKNAAGQQLTWEIPAFSKSRLSHIEVFKSEARELQAGDKIRWSRTDKQNELFSTDAAMVTVAEKDNITVTLANQKSFTFDPSNPKYQHWDNGYAATVYAVQGDTKSIILAHLESYRKNLTSQPTFMVALTRAVNEFRLYTDNAEALLRAVEKNSGVKMSSLEVIGEYPVMNAYGVENKNKLQQKMIKPQLEDISFKETNPAQPFRKMQAIADSILVKEAPISAKDIQDFAQKINQESTMKWQKTNQCQ
ncbi:MAG TPA: AAA family ATPase, partial [Gammaproteobacteria bacterium]|nr:AAA family ATPase [Gammaproteobacteria bacterium]